MKGKVVVTIAIVRGDDVRTGVTAVLPQDTDAYVR